MSNNAKQLSAKRIRTRNNVIVYIVLSILAVIWLFPVAWVVMTSFRAEKGSYVSTFYSEIARWTTTSSCSPIRACSTSRRCS